MPHEVATDQVSAAKLREACAELERRLNAGEAFDAEAVFAAHPELSHDADAALEVIYTEFVAREQLGRRPAPGEFFERFPRWRDALQQLFEIHGTVGAGSSVADSGRSDTALSEPGLESRLQPAKAGTPTLDGAARRIGNYEVLGEIGRGGMGVVYQARQIGLNRLVALKMILTGLDAGPRERARFRAEAEAAARLHHPNIVQIHEIGEHEGRPFLSLELVAGGSLDKRLTGTPWSATDAARLVEILARAIHHAHQQGVVHRDLKPANILLESVVRSPSSVAEESKAAEVSYGPRTTDYGLPKITDFGLAGRWSQWDAGKEAARGGTKSGAIVGTPAYMAPEQAAGDGRVIGPAADVYALGAMLYELLTGRPPFQAVNVLDTLLQVRTREPLPPSRLLPGLARDIETICLKCLRKEPGQRYPSAADLADDLGRFLRGEPVHARPTPAWERAWKWAKRRPAVAALLVSLIALTIAGLTSVTVLWRQTVDALGVVKVKQHEAEEAEADTGAYADFLAKHVLAATRPEGVQFGVGVNVTMAEALTKAEPALESVFRGRPRAEALARHQIGVTWRNLGRYDASERHLRRALELRRAVLGESADDTIDTMNSLATTLTERGKTAEAVRLATQVHDHWAAKLGADAPDSLDAATNLANAYAPAGRVDESITILEGVVKVGEAKAGRTDAKTLWSRHCLAVAYLEAGKRDDAIALLQDTLKDLKAKLGEDHPQTLGCMHTLASAYGQRQRDLALPLYEQGFAKSKATLGPDHPDTLTIMRNLAWVYRLAGRHAEALSLYEESLRLGEARMGRDHPHTLKTLTGLAITYKDLGRPADALPLLEEALRHCQSALSADHPDTTKTLGNLGHVLLEAGQVDRSLGLLADYVAGRRKQLTHDAHSFADLLAVLSAELVKYRQFAEAEKYFRECLAIREKIEPDHWATFNIRSHLGAALLWQKKYADAEPHLLAGYNGMKQREETPAANAPGSPFKQRLNTALQRLVQFYDAWGKPDEAAKWRKEVDHFSATPRQPPP